MSLSLCVFIALPCEAKPLIKAWHLKKHPHKHPFTIYTNDERIVVITGIGKIAMAGAVGYTLSLFPDWQHPLLLNLGIAGHRLHKLGSIFLADKILNMGSGKKYYPQFPFITPCGTAAVATLLQAETGYAEDYLYDMEAAGFYEMSCKFTSCELIHSLKIVSDNVQSPLVNISENTVEDWITEHLNVIEDVIAQLRILRGRLPLSDDSLFEEVKTTFHFSASGAIRLKNLLRNWRLFSPDQESIWKDSGAKSGKDFIVWLENQIEKNDFYL